jgi:hypothetical protein
MCKLSYLCVACSDTRVNAGVWSPHCGVSWHRWDFILVVPPASCWAKARRLFAESCWGAHICIFTLHTDAVLLISRFVLNEIQCTCSTLTAVYCLAFCAACSLLSRSRSSGALTGWAWAPTQQHRHPTSVHARWVSSSDSAVAAAAAAGQPHQQQQTMMGWQASKQQL